MEDERFGYPVFGQPRDPLPSRTIVLTAPPERSLPEFGDQEAERNKRLTVGRHGVIVEVALDDLSQPFSLDRNRLMHPPQPLFDGLQLRPHAIRPGLPFDLELAPARLAADEDKAQEAEGFRLAKPAPLAIFRRVLEADNEVVGIAHDDHVARGFAPSPAFGPEIEDVVQVDVGEKR